MTRHVRGRRIVENTWICSSCGTKNRGRDTRCKSCGSAKDSGERSQRVDPTTAQTVTDPELLRRARAGADLICPYCNSRVHRFEGNCPSCGGALGEAESFVPGYEGEKPGAEVEARDDVFAALTDCAQKKCPQCGTPNRRLTEHCTNCGASLHEAKAPSRPVHPEPRRRQPAAKDDDFEVRQYRHKRSKGRMRTFLITSTIVLMVGAFICLMIWLFVPHKVNARITGISWTHIVNIEERTPIHDEGWASGMPMGAYDKSCVNKFKESYDCNPYDCNCHDIDYDCNPHDCNCSESCRDTGTGFSECTTTCSTCYDTCSRTECDTCYESCDRYEDWCSYTYDTWPVVKSDSHHGGSHETTWPDLQPIGPDQRRKEIRKYVVNFAAEEKEWLFRPKSEGEFRKYSPGTDWEIKYNRAGMVFPQFELE